MSFLVSPLSSSRFFCFLVSFLLFSSLVLSLFPCLAFYVSLSLSSFSVFFLCLSISLCLRVMLCVVLCGVCRCGRGVVGGRGVCLVCVCCGTLKKRCRYTRGRFERTHGDVRRGKGEEGAGVVIVSPAYQNLPTYGYHVLQRFTEETFGSFPFSSLRIDREQHVPDSSNHSLSPIKLFSFSCPEGNKRLVHRPFLQA